MYTPSYFAERRPEVLHALMREHSFATLVTTNNEGGMVASHLPFLLDAPAGGSGVLLSHLALPNPQVQALEAGREVLVIFQGPHAYVSPRWYASRPNVPTWNYAVVHAHGRAEVLRDEAETLALLRRTVEFYEGPTGWTIDAAGEHVVKLQKAIVAFRVHIGRLEGKWKMSQNRSVEDQQGVIAALSASTAAGDHAVAKVMAERLPNASGRSLEQRVE